MPEHRERPRPPGIPGPRRRAGRGRGRGSELPDRAGAAAALLRPPAPDCRHPPSPLRARRGHRRRAAGRDGVRPVHRAPRSPSSTSPGSRRWTARACRSSPSSRPIPTPWPAPRSSTGSAAAKGARGPLHGIPVLLKDNIDTADRMTTTAGSLALEGSIAPRDSHVAERLRAAGAVLLAQGEHERVGQHPLQPLLQRLERARRAVPQSVRARPEPLRLELGLGGGRVGQLRRRRGRHRDRRVDRLPRLGQRRGRHQAHRRPGEPGGHHPDLAHPGHRRPALPARWPMRPRCSARWPARTRATAATAAAGGHIGPDYTAFLDQGGLRGARIGVARDEVLRLQRRHRPAGGSRDRGAAARGRRGGGSGRHPARRRPTTTPSWRCCCTSSRPTSTGYLAALGPTAPVRTLADVIAFNEREREREMPYFGQELFLQAEAKGPLTSPAYRKALATCRRLARAQGLDAVLAKHRLDAIVAPTGNPAWPTDLVNGDHFTGSSSTPAAVAGYPSVSVPMGYAWGLPVNLSFFGPRVERADADPAGVCIRADNHAPEGAALPADASLDSPPAARGFSTPDHVTSNRDLHGRHQRSRLRSGRPGRVVAGTTPRPLLLDAPDPVARGAAGQSVPADQGRRRAVPLAGTGGLRGRDGLRAAAARTSSPR